MFPTLASRITVNSRFFFCKKRSPYTLLLGSYTINIFWHFLKNFSINWNIHMFLLISTSKIAILIVSINFSIEMKNLSFGWPMVKITYIDPMYSVRNLDVSIRFSLKSRPSERFPRPEMSQIKAEISLRTNVKLICHKNVGL